VKKLTSPAGEQRVSLKSNELDGSGVAFNPLTEGLTVTLSDDGGPVWSGTIVPADPDWKFSSNKLKWRARSAVHPDGLKNLLIGIPGQPFAFKLTVKDGDVAAAAGAAALTVTLQVGDDVYEGSLPCTANRSGKTLSCR